MKRTVLLVVLLLCLLPLGAEAFVFSSQDIYGNKVDDSIFGKAKVTLVNVWGTYCTPCINEMPSLAKIQEEEKDVQVVGFVLDAVNSKGNPLMKTVMAARTILDTTGAGNYPHVLPTKALLTGTFSNVFAIPTTFIVNQKGEILETTEGSKSYEAWKKLLEKYL